jgi:hypothetical protein
VPCWGIGTWILTVGASRDFVAMVKFNAVVMVLVLEVREGTTKAKVCTGNVMCEPWLVKLKRVNESASVIFALKG